MKTNKDICNNPFFQQAILNSENLLILVLDRKGTVTFINNAGAKLLGYKPAEIIGKDWFENFLPEDIRERIYKVFENIINGRLKRFAVYQNAVLCRSGVIKVVHFTNAVIREGKRITGTLSVGIDITDYARKSEELKRLKEVNEILIDASIKLNKLNDIDKIADVIVRAAKKVTKSRYGYAGYIDEKTGYFYMPRFSREIMKECRLDDKEVLFKDFRGLWGWSLKNRKIILSNDVSKDKRASGIPKGHIRIDKFLALPVLRGKELIGQIAVANSVRDYNEQDILSLSRLVSLYNLALERARASEKLNDILKKFYISVEASGQIVYTYNLNTKKVFFEGNTEKLIGYSQDELPKTSEEVLKLIHPEDREKLSIISESSIDYIDTQLRFRKKDGDYIYIQLRGFTIRDKKSGESVRYGMVSDISERMRYENEILKREEEIRAIFENIPLPVAVMDRFRNIIFLNKAFTDTYGYERKDIADFDVWIKKAFPFASDKDIDFYTRLVFENEEGIDESKNIVLKLVGKNKETYYAKFFKKNVGKRIVLILENITAERLNQKKIDTINLLLKINTEINREIAKIEDTAQVVKKAVELFSQTGIFKDIHAFTFVEDEFRKLVRIDINGTEVVDDAVTPECILDSVKSNGRINIKRKGDDCSGCRYYNLRREDEVIIASFKENNIFYGNFVLVLKENKHLAEEELKILEGIGKDIALRIDNLNLQIQNRRYLERIKSIARFPTENPNPLVRIERSGILQYANPSAQDVIKAWEVAVGRPVPEYVKNDINFVFKTGNKTEKEYFISGKVYNAYIVPFPDSGYANIYFVDITEKKAKERALIESEERLRQILDVAPFGVYIVDSEYEIIYLNPYVRKELGEVEGRKCYEYFNGFDSPCEFCQMEKIKNGEVVRRIFQAPKTGRIYDLIDIPYRAPDRKICKLQIYNDITEIKQAEIKIKESEEKFRKLFNEAPVGYYLQDENGIFIDGNPVAEKLVGYKKEELIGRNFLEVGLIPEDRLSDAVEFFRRSIMGGEGGPFEQEILKKDGSRTTLEIFVRYIELGGKKIILGIASDISDRIRMQNEILRTNRELERLTEGLQEEVRRQTAESRKREKLAVVVKNIIVTATNLVSEDEILKETAYSLSEYMDFKAYGYYLSGRNDYNVNFFIRSGLCNIDMDYESFSENVLKYFARNYTNIGKPVRIYGEELNFFPEFAEKFRENCQEILLIPAVYKEINFGFMIFFLRKGTEIDDIIMDAFEQISIQLGTIIEQKMTEVAKAKLSRLYESVLSSAGDGIIGADKDLNITFINDAALKITGYSEKEVMGMNIHRLLHSGPERELHSIGECPFYLSLSTSNKVEREDALFFGSGGTEISVNKIVTPIVENGIVSGIVIVFRDITEEKKKLKEINRLATALGQYPVALGFIDKEGNIKYVNDAFEKHTDIPKDVLINMNIDDLNKGITQLIRRKPKENIYRQYNFEKKDQTRCFETVTVAPIIDSSGDVNDYVVIKEDITQHIEIQEANKAAKEDAERANMAKTAFLATITHEMRTPLTGVKGYINELASTDLDERQSAIVRKAQTVTDHLVSIINDVLDYSKIESGRMEIEHIGFDLFRSLEKVRSITGIKAEEKGLKFEFDVEKGIPRYLVGDPKRLEQVLINLISNAVKFTYEGGIYVNIVKKAEDGKKVILLFSVRDTGIGIKEEDKVRIFTPFSQADSSVSRKFGGTGLGLAITKYFVERMGGDIWVDSDLGKGSVFYFTAEFEVITEDKIEVEEKFVPLPMMLKGARILLAEDNEFNQELIANLLKKYGAEVDFAENGREAVDIIFSKPPDYYNFVLMDIQMPIMDGKTATKIIQEKELYKSLPIIAMTAHAFKDDVDDMLRAGMSAHIPKPFDESDALKVMSKYYFNRTAGLNYQEEKKESVLPDYLKNLTCVNVSEGIQRFSNDADSYSRMLRKFIEKYRDVDERLSQYIKENKLKEAEALVHTIKGVSGNLSIRGLYEKSIYLDRLLKENAPHFRIEEAFRSFSLEFKMAAEEIDRLPVEEERESVIIEDGLYKEKLLKLREALEGGDAESIEIFLCIRGNLLKEIGKDNV